MIMIDPSTEPDFLSSATVTNALDRIRKRINADESPVIEKAEEKIWRNEKVTDALYDSHNGKCCYCERKRDRKSEMNVEHYRPKGKVYGEEDHTGYWWLVYTWNNLLWSCKACNQRYKDTHFTLLPGATRANDEESDLELERPCLINPKLEDPSQFISFHIDKGGGRCFIRAVPREGIDSDMRKRAEETIRIVGLNRDETGYDLIEERGNEFSASTLKGIVISLLAADQAKDVVPANRQDFIDSMNSLRERLKTHIRSDRVFSGVYRDYLRRNEIEYENLL